jgi:GT2 family glycosyltransferase
VDLSVVMPVHNRPVAAANVLRSLRHQTLSPDSFDVVVVDDGSSEPLLESIAPLLDQEGIDFGVRWVRHDVAKGVQAARNAGAAQAGGGLLVFLDVDCIAHPDLLGAHLRAHRDRRVAVCGYTSARELSPAAWRLLLGADWDFGDSAATFDRAAGTPLLHDPLTELLAEPRPSDWSFFWTHNVSIPRWAFDKVGGFNGEFPYKGVEDMEMGYRLAREGCPTVFAPDARAIHQPHDRTRGLDIAQDRHNEHVLVRMYPTVEVEAVCSYDIVNSREMVPVLERFSDTLAVESADTSGLTALTQLRERIDRAGDVLLVGSTNGWPTGLPLPAAVVFPGKDGTASRSGEADRFPLVGTRMPFDADQFDLGIVSDYWRLFPERTASRIFAETLRVCRQVMVLSGVSGAPADQPDGQLAAALDAYDHPFWEFTVRVRRELHEFGFTEFERAGTGAAAFDLTETSWPSTDLATAVRTAPAGADRRI